MKHIGYPLLTNVFVMIILNSHQTVLHLIKRMNISGTSSFISLS